ncbi:MAG: Stf0 family sulfotransferase [Chloroflexota bacterium]|nr:Stf0 family sulfotransferase [Chloroflexota bacterium]
MTQPPRYLILATPRSGSTLLGQGLQATGLAGDPKEFFGHRMAFWMERWGTPTLATYAARLTQARATPNGVFGAKLLYRQLLHLERVARDDPALADLPLAGILSHIFPNLHVVWVSREDKVRQAISWYKARQTGVWGQDQAQPTVKLGAAWRRGDEPLQPGELAFDYDGIAALFRQAETEDAAIGRFFAESGIDPFQVVYEEFSPRYEETVFALLRWMGIKPPADLTLPNPRTVKLADDRTEEWVARFRELRATASDARLSTPT